MWPGWKLLYATFRPGHRLHAWPPSSVSWCETDSRVLSKVRSWKRQKHWWKEARYIHHCSKKTHSSIMNISFGLYMRKKEISNVLSPQKFIAANTSGIAFYRTQIEALHFQEEVHPLEYPQHKEEKASIFWSEILQTIHYTQIPSSATLCVSVFLSGLLISTTLHPNINSNK